MSNAILVVDDNATIRHLARKTLSGAGYKVVEAENGADGLECAKGQQFGMVLTDINMPVMGGMDMFKALRGLDNYKKTPLIVLSTESTREMVDQGKQAGANGWMVKPFEPDKLLNLVKKVVPVP